MRLLVIEARYPQQMSYIDNWRKAWEATSHTTQTVNLASGNWRDSLRAAKADVAVLLHSVTADTNRYLEALVTQRQLLSGMSVVVHVGNEFNSPLLSMERRLSLLEELQPQVIASQLTEGSAVWLYNDLGSKVVSAPQGMPKPQVANRSRNWDISYVGFPYPSYLGDQDRRQLLRAVREASSARGCQTYILEQRRLDPTKWIDLLCSTKVTFATEAGAHRVFRTDGVWQEVAPLLRHQAIIQVGNDNRIAHLARRLPTSVKQVLRLVMRAGRVQFGGLLPYEDELAETLAAHIAEWPERSTDGKCISSRHLEALACGTWQLLLDGPYNGILSPEKHYTPLVTLKEDEVREKLSVALKTASEIQHDDRWSNEIWEMYTSHSFDARVLALLGELS